MIWSRNKFNNTYNAAMESIERLYNTRESLLPEIRKHYDAVMELREYPEYKTIISDPKYADYATSILVDTEIEAIEYSVYKVPLPNLYDERKLEISKMYEKVQDPSLSKNERKTLELEILDSTEKLNSELTVSLEGCTRAVRELPKIAWDITQEMRGERVKPENDAKKSEPSQDTEQSKYVEPHWSKLQFETMYTNISANIDRMTETRYALAAEVKKYYFAVEDMLKYPANGIDIAEVDDVQIKVLSEALNPKFNIEHREDTVLLSSTYHEAIFNRSLEQSVLNTAAGIYSRLNSNIETCIQTIEELEQTCQKQVQAMRHEADQEHSQEYEPDIFQKFEQMYSENEAEQDYEYELNR